jgi:hypothetical protein
VFSSDPLAIIGTKNRSYRKRGIGMRSFTVSAVGGLDLVLSGRYTINPIRIFSIPALYKISKVGS